jgi:hypothetical protein
MKRTGSTIAILAGVAAIALVVAWLERETITRSYIDDALAQKGVVARYDIKQIGYATQRLEKISIGDPARPDLVADWIEVDTGNYFSGVTVSAVRAGRVQLNGTLHDGALTLGSIDKLLPAPTNEPFKLPDLPITLQGGEMRLDSDWGRIGFGLAGKGGTAPCFGRLCGIRTQPASGCLNRPAPARFQGASQSRQHFLRRCEGQQC